MRQKTVGRRVAKTNKQSNTAGAGRSRWEPIEIRFNVRVLNPVEARLDAKGVCLVAHASAAAKSRIMDADFASETANLSRSQILQQAGTAMIAQANQLPQGVLALLR